MTSARPDIVVLSHLRWNWVWQRPQHLISRLARGRHVWFVEEPMREGAQSPALRSESLGEIRRMWLSLPGESPHILRGIGHVGFDAAEAAPLGPALLDALPRGSRPVVWLYTPLALEHVTGIERAALVYDVMDDLAAFRHAAPALRRAQRATLAAADLVMTGGRSLDAGIRRAGARRSFLFPSGVDTAHFAPAVGMRRRGRRPVAGYVGVIDERVDLELVGALARRLPDWEIQMVGPVAKIEPESLPREPNLVYPGMQPYERLPEVMAGFDVALMPFALNEATRSISPTKTLEYLAAGLPVVSTRVPDVVADHASVVALADDAAGFADAVRVCGREDPAARVAAMAPTLRRHEWDAIASRMNLLIERAVAGLPPAAETEPLHDDAAAAAVA